MHKLIIPPIKIQGIKSKLVEWINSIIPKDFNGNLIEPFMGSGVVGINLAKNGGILCDINPHLINFYNSIKSGNITAQSVKEYLAEEGASLAKLGEDYYYSIRGRFNNLAEPLDFLFLNRACFNGLMRFNKRGYFNTPFCRKPERFSKAYITKITNQVQNTSDLINKHEIKFTHQGFEKTIEQAKETDLIYCDPPYITRHSDYFNKWTLEDEDKLFQMLSNFKGKFILSTWKENACRENISIAKWNKFSIITKDHFYHVGAREVNRKPIVEALIINF